MATAAEVMLLIRAKDDASAVLDQLHSKHGVLAGGLAALGTAGIAAGAAMATGIGYAVNAAADFEQVMSGVQAASGATKDEFEALSKKALQLGKDTVFSAKEAAQGIEELVKGGIPLADILNGAAEAALNLATAGGVSLVAAAEQMSDAMNIFQIKGEGAAHVADLISGAANASSMSVGDFGFALKAVGLVAKLAGQDFDSTATAIAVMAQQGLKGSDAGTSLKAVLVNLQPETSRARAAFEALGITMADGSNRFIRANGEFKDLAEISEILQEGTSRLTEAQRTLYLEMAFGTDGMRAATALSTAGAEGFKKMGDAMMATGGAAEIARIRLDNLKGDIEQINGSANTLSIMLGQTLTPSLRGVAQVILEEFNQAITLVESLSVTIRGLVETDGLSQLDATLQAIAMQLEVTFGPQTARLFEGVTQAVGDVAGAFAGFFRQSEEGSSGFTTMVETISGILNGLGGAIDRYIDSIGQFIINVLLIPRRTVESFTALAAGIGAALGEIATRVGGFFDALGSQVQQGIRTVGDLFSGLGTKAHDAVTAVGDAFSGMGRTVDEALGGLVETVGGIFDSIGTAVHDALQHIADEFGRVWGGIPQDIRDDMGLILTTIVQRGADFLAAVVDFMADIARTLSEAWEGVRDAAGEAMSRLGSVYRDEWDTITGIVGDVMSAIGTIVHDAWEGLVDIVGGVMSAIGSQVRSGWDTITGAVGQAMSDIGTAVRTTWDGMTASVGQAMSDLGTAIRGAWDGIKTAVGEKLDEIIASIATFFGQMNQGGAEIGTNMIDGLRRGIGDGIEGVKSFIGDKFRGLIQVAKDALVIASPSVPFVAIGRILPHSVELGFEEAMPELEAAVEEMGGELPEAMAAGMRQNQGAVVHALDGFMHELVSNTANFKAEFGAAGGALASALSVALRDGTDKAGKDVAKSLDKLVDDMRKNGVRDWREMGDAIADALHDAFVAGTPEAAAAAHALILEAVEAIEDAKPKAKTAAEHFLGVFIATAKSSEMVALYGDAGAGAVEAMTAAFNATGKPAEDAARKAGALLIRMMAEAKKAGVEGAVDTINAIKEMLAEAMATGNEDLLNEAYAMMAGVAQATADALEAKKPVIKTAAQRFLGSMTEVAESSEMLAKFGAAGSSAISAYLAAWGPNGDANAPAKAGNALQKMIQEAERLGIPQAAETGAHIRAMLATALENGDEGLRDAGFAMIGELADSIVAAAEGAAKAKILASITKLADDSIDKLRIGMAPAAGGGIMNVFLDSLSAAVEAGTPAAAARMVDYSRKMAESAEAHLSPAKAVEMWTAWQAAQDAFLAGDHGEALRAWVTQYKGVIEEGFAGAAESAKSSMTSIKNSTVGALGEMTKSWSDYWDAYRAGGGQPPGGGTSTGAPVAPITPGQGTPGGVPPGGIINGPPHAPQLWPMPDAAFLDKEFTELFLALSSTAAAAGGFSQAGMDYLHTQLNQAVGNAMMNGQMAINPEGLSDLVYNGVQGWLYQSAPGSFFNSGFNPASSSIPAFGEGGIVPGPRGAAQLAIVHGGETITPPGMGGGVYVDMRGAVVYGMDDMERLIAEAWSTVARRGGFTQYGVGPR